MESEKLKDLEKDLQGLVVFCKEQGMNEKEIRKLFSPLAKKGFTKKLILILLLIILIIWLLSKVEYFTWHLSAVGRIAMIKFLDIYDWRGLKNSRGCLLKNGQTQRRTIVEECYFCEGLKSIPYSEITSAEYLKEMFLDLEKPVIIPHNISSKPDLSEIFTDIINDASYSNTIPCKLATNIFSQKSHTIYEILKKIHKHYTFFAHFQNCDFDAVKEFRKIIPRPDFLVAEVAPIQYSWVVASRDYDVDVFKQLQLSDHLCAVIQILGSNTYNLTPYKGCRDDCKHLQGELYAGEVLLLTSRWDLAYKPDGIGENFAVILESH